MIIKKIMLRRVPMYVTEINKVTNYKLSQITEKIARLDVNDKYYINKFMTGFDNFKSKIVIGCFVVIYTDDHYYVLQRRNGLIGLIGGKVDNDDFNYISVIERESKEESGLDLSFSVVDLIYVHEYEPNRYSFIFKKKINKDQRDQIINVEAKKHLGIIQVPRGKILPMEYILDPRKYLNKLN